MVARWFSRPARVLSVLIGVSATLSAQVVRMLDASGREVERRCEQAQWPKTIPALDALVDSAALVTAIEALPRDDTTAILFSILYSQDGSASARLLGRDSLVVRTSLSAALTRGLRAVSPPTPFGAVRLRLLPGHAPAVERSVYCPPAPDPAPGGPSAPRRVRVEVRPGDRTPPIGPSQLASDYEPLCKLGVPYVFFWTPDARCYHQTCDTADRIDYRYMVDIAALAACGSRL